MTLAAAKVTLDRHMPENMSCSIFTKGKHESARTASRLIGDLFKNSIHLCDLENVEQINNIRDTFIRVYALVAAEKSSFGKTTFWDDILDLMNHVLNQENQVLKMDKSSFASGRR